MRSLGIYPLQASASSMSSGYGGEPTARQSIAEIMNLSFRCSYTLSRDDQDGGDSSVLYDSVRGTLRVSPDWQG